MSEIAHDITANIPFRLKWVRESLGLSQRAFADFAGLNHTQLNNWETGFRRISVDGALSIRAKCGVTLDFIYCGDARLLPAHLFEKWMSLREDPL